MLLLGDGERVKIPMQGGRHDPRTQQAGRPPPRQVPAVGERLGRVLDRLVLPGQVLPDLLLPRLHRHDQLRQLRLLLTRPPTAPGQCRPAWCRPAPSWRVLRASPPTPEELACRI